jgi:hypothetical protein
MQIESGNNYNPLGRLGPLYPRPEYRPGNSSKDTPEKAKDGGQDQVSLAGGKGDKSKAKAQKGQKAQASAVNADSRLSLQSAKALTEATAEEIKRLPPQGRNQGPHAVKGLGLMAPRYV